MKSIEELQADLKQLYAELEERKIMEQESVTNIVNFEEISSRAERCQIENPSLWRKKMSMNRVCIYYFCFQ